MNVPSDREPAASNPASERRVRGAFVRGLAAGMLLAAFLSGLAYLWLRAPSPPPIVVHAPPANLSGMTEPISITVYVSGEVARPGIYLLPKGARVADALAFAGGMTENSDAVLVNQALRLSDGAHVVVPPLGSVDAGVRGGAVDLSAVTGGENGVVATPMNINTASLEELMELPGIGKVRAEQIAAGRPYTSVDGLDRVSGIGPATLEKLRQLVTAP